MKTNIEEKLKLFTDQHKIAVEELNKLTILVHKYEGAIEGMQILLKEIEEKSVKEVKEDKKTK